MITVILLLLVVGFINGVVNEICNIRNGTIGPFNLKIK